MKVPCAVSQHQQQLGDSLGTGMERKVDNVCSAPSGNAWSLKVEDQSMGPRGVLKCDCCAGGKRPNRLLCI